MIDCEFDDMSADWQGSLQGDQTFVTKAIILTSIWYDNKQPYHIGCANMLTEGKVKEYVASFIELHKNNGAVLCVGMNFVIF